MLRRAIAAAGFASLLALVGGSGSVSADSSRTDLKNFQHVFVIMMENTGFDTLIGNANAPWINSAANTYGLASDYFGVTHPSQPNYIALTSGSTNGITTDNDATINVANLADQVEASGRTWKSYNQNLALCTTKFDHACGNQLYERKHNPFVSYTDIASNPARMANVVDLSQLNLDLASGDVPDFSFIDPDQCHDMHGRGGPLTDPCRFANISGLIATGDEFLKETVGAIMASSAWNGNSVIFIQWDESDFTNSGPIGFGDTSGCCDSPTLNGHLNGGGHVVSLVISHSNHAHVTSGTAFNHYSVLRTIEDGWQLGCLAFTCDTANVPEMGDLTGPRG